MSKPQHIATQVVGCAAREQFWARVLASLNHPNIAQIHGIEEDEGNNGSDEFSVTYRFIGPNHVPEPTSLVQ